MSKREIKPLPLFGDLEVSTKEAPEEQPPPTPRQFAPPRHNDLALYICHRQEAEEIFQRKSDGYFDATAMCRAYGKLFSGYSRLESTEEFFAELESDMQIHISHLVESNRSGPYSTRGTWVHPEVAVDLAQWLSPKFRKQVNRWVFAWMQGRQPAFNRDDIEPFVIGRMLTELKEGQQLVLGICQRIDRHTTQTMSNTFRGGPDAPDEIEISLPEKTEQQEATPVEPIPGDWRTWKPVRNKGRT